VKLDLVTRLEDLDSRMFIMSGHLLQEEWSHPDLEHLAGDVRYWLSHGYQAVANLIHALEEYVVVE